MSVQPWKRIEPTTITKVGRRTIVTKTFEKPDGSTTTFDILHPDGQEFATIVAVTPEGKVVTSREYRAGPERVMTDLPGGFVDIGESPQSAALRELLEETGYEPESITELGVYSKDPYMNGKWHVFLATDCKKVAEQSLHGEENAIDIVEMTLAELLDEVKAGNVSDTCELLMAYDALIGMA